MSEYAETTAWGVSEVESQESQERPVCTLNCHGWTSSLVLGDVTCVRTKLVWKIVLESSSWWILRLLGSLFIFQHPRWETFFTFWIFRTNTRFCYFESVTVTFANNKKRLFSFHYAYNLSNPLVQIKLFSSADFHFHWLAL